MRRDLAMGTSPDTKASWVSSNSLETGKTLPVAFSTTDGPRARANEVLSTEKMPFLTRPCCAVGGCKRMTTEEDVCQFLFAKKGGWVRKERTRQECTSPNIIVLLIRKADFFEILDFERVAFPFYDSCRNESFSKPGELMNKWLWQVIRFWRRRDQVRVVSNGKERQRD